MYGAFFENKGPDLNFRFTSSCRLDSSPNPVFCLDFIEHYQVLTPPCLYFYTQDYIIRWRYPCTTWRHHTSQCYVILWVRVQDKTCFGLVYAQWDSCTRQLYHTIRQSDGASYDVKGRQEIIPIVFHAMLPFIWYHSVAEFSNNHEIFLGIIKKFFIQCDTMRTSHIYIYINIWFVMYMIWYYACIYWVLVGVFLQWTTIHKHCALSLYLFFIQASNIKHSEVGQENSAAHLKICKGNISHDLPMCQNCAIWGEMITSLCNLIVRWELQDPFQNTSFINLARLHIKTSVGILKRLQVSIYENVVLRV